MMSSLERLVSALEGGRPDRTPVALHNFLMTGRYAGFDDLSVWLQDGAMIAAATAALKATRPGGQNGIPRRKEVETFLQENR